MLESLQKVRYSLSSIETTASEGDTVSSKNAFSREGYLHENYHYFHLKDSAGQERSFHFHEFDKLVLLLSGKVEYVVENTAYTLQPWSVLLVRHHAIHRAMIDVSEPYERIILYLDSQFFERTLPDAGLMDCFETADRTGQYLLLPNTRQQQALADAVAAYERAASDDAFGSQALRDTLVIQMLIQIGRMIAAGSEGVCQYDP